MAAVLEGWRFFYKYYMKITYKTRTKDILPLINEKNINDLLDVVPPYPLEKPIMSMTIKEFALMLDSESDFLARLMSHKRALISFGRLKQYKIEIENIGNFMKRFECKHKPEEEQAARGILFPDTSMRMLIDCVKFFHLKSFEEAEQCKVSDWLIIMQNDGANTLFERKLHEIWENKSKHKHQR